MTNEISTIIISLKVRFIRFGYDWFEIFLAKFDVKIIVVSEDEEVEKSVQNRD